MILYFADRSLNILGTASTDYNENYMISDDSRDQDVDNGTAIFQFKFYFSEPYENDVRTFVLPGNYILLRRDSEDEVYTVLYAELDRSDKSYTVYAEDAGLDLYNSVCDKYDPESALDAAMANHRAYAAFKPKVGNIANKWEVATYNTGEDSIIDASALANKMFDKNGNEGTSTNYYIHLAYANKNSDGDVVDFSLTDRNNRQYVGNYKDMSESDSTDPNKYSWVQGKDNDNAVKSGTFAVHAVFGVANSHGKVTSIIWNNSINPICDRVGAAITKGKVDGITKIITDPGNKKYSIDNIVTYLRTPTKNAMDKVDSLSNGTTSFIVITDTHGLANKQHSQAVVRYLLDNSKTIKKCFWLGDVSNLMFSNDEYSTFSAPLKPAKSQIYFAIGNHDLAGINHSDACNLFYNDWLSDKSVHGNPRELYYYFDDVEHKIRYIVIKTQTSYSTYHIDDTQISWIKTAVQVPSTDWGVAVLGHIDLWQGNVTGAWCVNNGNDVISAIKTTNGRLIGYFCGHEHVDQMSNINGFHQTMLLCDRFDLDNYFADKGLKYPSKIEGTASEQTVTIVSINQNNRSVKFTRIGTDMVNGTEDYTY